MLEFGPPTEHRSGAEMRLLADGSYHLAVGSTEMGNGSATSHRQIAASVLNTRASNIALVNGNTDATPYDTGTFASTGTVVAGQAVEKAARALRDKLLEYASRNFGCAASECSLQDDAIICANRKIPLTELYAEGAKAGDRFDVIRKAYLSPRSVGFNVHGVRARRASRHRRDRDLAECARRRHRQTDQSDPVPRPDRRRHRHGFRLDALREHGVQRRTARW